MGSAWNSTEPDPVKKFAEVPMWMTSLAGDSYNFRMGWAEAGEQFPSGMWSSQMWSSQMRSSQPVREAECAHFRHAIVEGSLSHCRKVDLI